MPAASGPARQIPVPLVTKGPGADRPAPVTAQPDMRRCLAGPSPDGPSPHDRGRSRAARRCRGGRARPAHGGESAGDGHPYHAHVRVAQAWEAWSPNLGVFAVSAGVFCTHSAAWWTRYLDSVSAAGMARISLSLLLLEQSGYCVNTIQQHVNATDVLVRPGKGRDGSRYPPLAVARQPVWLLQLHRRNVLLDDGCRWQRLD